MFMFIEISTWTILLAFSWPNYQFYVCVFVRKVWESNLDGLLLLNGNRVKKKSVQVSVQKSSNPLQIIVCKFSLGL